MLIATRPHDPVDTGPGPTLPDRLREAAQQRPQAEAVVEGLHRLSYAQLLERAESFATGLRRRGVVEGDVVLIQLPNWWETTVAVWGTWLAGGVVLPVVPIYRAHELAFILGQVRPAAVVTAQSYRGYEHAVELRRLVDAGDHEAVVIGVRMSEPVAGVDDGAPLFDGPRDVDETTSRGSCDDIALILYTSGTTSAPKGALHSHRTLLAESTAVREWCRVTSDDRIFMPSPLSHITGVSYAIVLPVDVASVAVLMDRWDPAAAVDLVEAEACTFTVSATPFLRGLTEEYGRRGLRSALTRFVCGGADIPPELVRRAHAVMGTAVVRTYGSTEMPTLVMADPFGDLDAAADAEGGLMAGSHMQLRDDGTGATELLARGPELFLGYVDADLNADAFTSDGWFRTGDAATIDAAGSLRISGRIKDIINRGGEKYSAAEVEWALLSHPDVIEIAIVGVPDESLGERACAIVVAEPGSAPTLDGLREFLLAAGFAVQKAPELLRIVDELPRTASGKVQKFRLREGLRLAAFADQGEPRA